MECRAISSLASQNRHPEAAVRKMTGVIRHEAPVATTDSIRSTMRTPSLQVPPLLSLSALIGLHRPIDWSRTGPIRTFRDGTKTAWRAGVLLKSLIRFSGYLRKVSVSYLRRSLVGARR